MSIFGAIVFASFIMTSCGGATDEAAASPEATAMAPASASDEAAASPEATAMAPASASPEATAAN